VPRRVLALLGLGTLLLAPSAAGVPPPGVPPEITPLIFGTVGANHWYTSNVTVNWRVETHPDWPIRESRGCDARTLDADTPGTSLTCYARNDAGETTKTLTIKLDKTAPAVSGAANRQPDANGWYNRPLRVSFSASDGTSGVEACSWAGYSGPDTPTASVSGSCWDRAGNVGAAVFSFKYDATPPTLAAVRTKPGNRIAVISWKQSNDTRQAEIRRSPGLNGAAESVIYRGSAAAHRDSRLKPGRKYRYTVAVFDEAANSSSRKVDFVGRGALLYPAPGERVSSPPLLVWTPVRGATYYNVVLVRARRVYSGWPVRPRLQLPRSWVYHGKRHRLRPGVYRWFVWPGFRQLSAGQFGRLQGGSTFVVAG
jgi:hypothetical protein